MSEIVFCFVLILIFYDWNNKRKEIAELKREIIAYQASLTNAVNGINHGH